MSSSPPRISVVTPSFNQGRYLEATIQSVLSQAYPSLEYIVIDGGSADDSVAILQRYAPHFAYWVSEPDAGQTQAINKGFARATGDWLCWLSSDDIYLPRALERLARIIQNNPGVEWISGGVIFADGDLREWRRAFSRHTLGQARGAGPSRFVTGTWRDLVCESKTHNFLSQPSSFWSRRAYARIGPFDETLDTVMDYEYWIRMARAGMVPLCVKEYFSVRRFHHDAKTVKVAGAMLRAQLAVIDRNVAAATSAERPLLQEYRRWFAGRIWWRSVLRRWNLRYAMPLVAAVKSRTRRQVLS
jgi:glycosyltransferase involved in cell wall biosynthesis